ncbi:MAG: helix-turn-helix domain-containing protein [Sporomusaceae bacterium]|nr:helix-turn-helix domain-containing protein [Sporomusaceae bacterium]
MPSHIRQLFQEELEQLAQIKQICSDSQYQDNSLLGHYSRMATIFERNLQSMMKMTKISDSQQNYLQEIQQELEREIEERIKAEEKLANSYQRHRRNQLLLELAEGSRLFDDAAWTAARQLQLFWPERFQVYYLKLTGWQGAPFSRTVDAAAVQSVIDTAVDRFNSCPGIVAWEWDSGIGLLHAAAAGSDKARQVAIGLELKKQVSDYCAAVQMAVGIAGIQGTAEKFARQCYQARSAANLGCRLWPGRDAYHYDDGEAYQLLYPLADGQDAGDFIDRTIGRLMDYDRNNKSDLLPTLRQIIQAPNLKVVAETMFLHHKTIVSRKQRIETVLGVSLDAFEIRFNIAIALHLLQFRQ